jgi:ribosomal protein S18 acetylase RimI-like enzyme
MYYQSLYVYGKKEQAPNKKLVLRNYTEHDFDQLIDIQRESFPPPFPSELWWSKEQLRNHITLYPQGAICAEIDGGLVGSITGLKVNLPTDPLGASHHNWEEVTDKGYIRNHDPNGEILYIVDISVRPSYRQWGIGKRLMSAMYDVVIHENLNRLWGGGRMSGYHRVAEKMSAEQYLEAIVAGKMYDPVITFLLRCGRTPVTVMQDYLEDEESHNFAALMEWRNPFYSRED